jgi:hypothetical protein
VICQQGLHTLLAIMAWSFVCLTTAGSSFGFIIMHGLHHSDCTGIVFGPELYVHPLYSS